MAGWMREDSQWCSLRCGENAFLLPVRFSVRCWEPWATSKTEEFGGDPTQQRRIFVTQTDKLSVIPNPHKVKGDNQLQKVVLSFHTHTTAYVHTCTYIHGHPQFPHPYHRICPHMYIHSWASPEVQRKDQPLQGTVTHRQGSVSTSSSTVPAADKQRNPQDYNQDANPCSPGPGDRHVQ